MSILRLENVIKTYDKHTAVNNVSFDVPKGSIFGLLGPNGAGKTNSIATILAKLAICQKNVDFIKK